MLSTTILGDCTDVWFLLQGSKGDADYISAFHHLVLPLAYEVSLCQINNVVRTGIRLYAWTTFMFVGLYQNQSLHSKHVDDCGVLWIKWISDSQFAVLTRRENCIVVNIDTVTYILLLNLFRIKVLWKIYSVVNYFQQFAPDLVIVAAGFDAEKTDSLVSGHVSCCKIYLNISDMVIRFTH